MKNICCTSSTKLFYIIFNQVLDWRGELLHCIQLRATHSVLPPINTLPHIEGLVTQGCTQHHAGLCDDWFQWMKGSRCQGCWRRRRDVTAVCNSGCIKWWLGLRYNLGQRNHAESTEHTGQKDWNMLNPWIPPMTKTQVKYCHNILCISLDRKKMICKGICFHR